MAEVTKRWRLGLGKGDQAVFRKIFNLFISSDITSELWDELEAALIQADLGAETTCEILSELQRRVDARGFTNALQVKEYLPTVLLERLSSPELPVFTSSPSVILVVGVNGSGKTTVVAKLGNYYKKKGIDPIFIAADTFRAAAIDQLQIWAERLSIPMISGQVGSDPGAVVYDGIQSAIRKNKSLVIIDTAGRLHTRFNLMEELRKVHRTVGKACPGAPHAVWLTIDATTGQNALLQARAFLDAVAVTGILLTKLDTSARGGMVFAIKKELKLPILFAGVGENIDDLEIFDPGAFVNGVIPAQ